MTDKNEPDIKLLTPSHNFAIVKLRDRSFPGIHFQADSTSIILSELLEIKKNLSERNTEEVNDIVDELIAKFDHILNYYERVASEQKFEVPYYRQKGPGL